MKTLVMYYSNTGNTKTVAEALAGRMNADIEEIRERKARPALQVPKEGEKPEGSGVMKAAMAGFLGLSSRIEDAMHDPSAYDLVVVGTPVWAGGLVPPVRSYIKKHRKGMHLVAFFCTAESPERSRAFGQMSKTAHQEPAAVLAVTADDVRNDRFDSALSSFVLKLMSQDT